MLIQQEPKYTIDYCNLGLVNRSTGVGIPDDEPIFILRAKDKHAIETLRFYSTMVESNTLTGSIDERILCFIEFSHRNTDRMKEPD